MSDFSPFLFLSAVGVFLFTVFKWSIKRQSERDRLPSSAPVVQEANEAEAPAPPRGEKLRAWGTRLVVVASLALVSAPVQQSDWTDRGTRTDLMYIGWAILLYFWSKRVYRIGAVDGYRYARDPRPHSTAAAVIESYIRE